MLPLITISWAHHSVTTTPARHTRLSTFVLAPSARNSTETCTYDTSARSCNTDMKNYQPQSHLCQSGELVRNVPATIRFWQCQQEMCAANMILMLQTSNPIFWWHTASRANSLWCKYLRLIHIASCTNVESEPATSFDILLWSYNELYWITRCKLIWLQSIEYNSRKSVYNRPVCKASQTLNAVTPVSPVLGPWSTGDDDQAGTVWWAWL